MTSFSALKRHPKTSRASSTLPQVPVHIEHVLGFTSSSNCGVDQNHSIIAYAAGSTIILSDKHTQAQEFIISTARKTITSLSVSSDGRYLATGECGHESKVRVWDLAGDRKNCIELGDHKFAIDCVQFSPKGNRLVSIGSQYDGNIYVWNWQNKTKLNSNKCLCSVRHMAFADNGNYFITVGNRHVKFWYLTSKVSHATMPMNSHDAILGIYRNNIFTDVICGRDNFADSAYVLSANGLILRFDENRKLVTHKNLQKKTNCLGIGGMCLIVGCDKGIVDIIALATLELIVSIMLPNYNPWQSNSLSPNTIAVCLDEVRSLLTCFYSDHSFFIWNINDKQSIKMHDCHLYHSESGRAIEIGTNPSPTTLRQLEFITCSSDNTIRFWSLNQCEPDPYLIPSQSARAVSGKYLTTMIHLDENLVRSESAPKISGRCLKIAPHGLSLAVGDLSGNIRIFDMQTLKQIQFIEAHDSEVLCLDYCHSTDMDVTFLASGSRDRLIHVFDASNNYQHVTTLDDHTGTITAIRFTFSSTTSKLQLISCSTDKSLVFRSVSKDVDNGKYVFVRMHNIFENQTFYDLTVDHSHELVFAACQGRIIGAYSIHDGRRVRLYKCPQNDTTSNLIKIDINISGTYVAASCSNRYVYLWDTKTSTCVASLCGFGETVTDLKFSHDEQRLYTITNDGCIFIWAIGELHAQSTKEESISTPLPNSQQFGTDVSCSSNDQPFLSDEACCCSNKVDDDSVVTIESSFSKENDDHEQTLVNTAMSAVEVFRHSLDRKNSLSSRFLSLSKEKRTFDVLPKPLDMIQEQSTVPFPITPRLDENFEQRNASSKFSFKVHDTSTTIKRTISLDNLIIPSKQCELRSSDDNNGTDITMRQSRSPSELTNLELLKDSNTHEDHMTTIDHLADRIHKCLDELENLHATVIQDSDTQSATMRQTIERIFSNIHIRLTNIQYQQE